jgi:hypothetical protein
MTRPIKEENWYMEAAQLMARTGQSLKQACTELEVEITNEEAAILLRRASFNRLLWQERHRYFRELAADPNFSVDTVVGRLMNLALKLEEEGENDKSAEVYLKIAKVRGWVGPESQVSVFGELSQRDLDSIRKQVETGTIKHKSVN